MHARAAWDLICGCFSFVSFFFVFIVVVLLRLGATMVSSESTSSCFRGAIRFGTTSLELYNASRRNSFAIRPSDASRTSAVRGKCPRGLEAQIRAPFYCELYLIVTFWTFHRTAEPR